MGEITRRNPPKCPSRRTASDRVRQPRDDPRSDLGITLELHSRAVRVKRGAATRNPSEQQPIEPNRSRRVTVELLDHCGTPVDGEMVLLAVHARGASLGPRSPRVLVARLLRACALAKRGDRAQASLLIESTAVALRDELGTDYYVTLVSEGDAQLFQTAPRDASWRQHADALAARIENTLAWQAGAAELVAWLRAPHDRHDWQKLPVVL